MMPQTPGEWAAVTLFAIALGAVLGYVSVTVQVYRNIVRWNHERSG